MADVDFDELISQTIEPPYRPPSSTGKTFKMNFKPLNEILDQEEIGD